MSLYFEELCHAMEMLAQEPKTIFLGQSVVYPGTAMSKTFSDVSMEKCIEMPVAEDFQMGLAIGMALHGYLPVCIYPRWNFLLLAANQLVLHLDKIPLYSNGGYRPKVIIRTAVATDEPLDPGYQHLGDFTQAFRSILTTVQVQELFSPQDVRRCYKQALESEWSTLLVERAENY